MRSSISRTIVLLVCLLTIGAMAWVGAAAAAASPLEQAGHQAVLGSTVDSSAQVEECAATPPPDHAEPDGGTADVIGWVEGVWYNESISIDDRDALTEAELEQLTARTAARVEVLRCLTFEEVPPIEFRTQVEHLDDLESAVEADLDEPDRDFANAQFAAMFFVGQDENAMDVWLENRAATPIAFYDTEEEFIGFITEDPDEIQVDETTITHELVHALQDQHFDVDPVFEENTTDGFMSSLAVVEGEAVLVAQLYEDNCGRWVDDCILVESGSDEPPHWGFTLEFLAAYNAPLVAHTYETKGWAGVDELHAEMPGSMVEALVPEKYGDFERQAIEVPDRSTDEWSRVTPEDGPSDITGQHALTAMLVAPTYETQGQRSVVDIDPFLQEHHGGAVDFNHPATSGWRADKLFAYERANGDLAGVWKLAWADDESAVRFMDAYEELIEFRGGERAADFPNVFTFEGAAAYDMAVGLQREGDRILIVTAPSVEDLTAVHADFALEEPAPAEFVIADVSPNDTELEEGDAIQLRVSIDNRGDSPDAQTVRARLAGTTVAEERVEIDAGGRRTMSLEFDAAGTPPGTVDVVVETADDEATVSLTIVDDAGDRAEPADDVDDGVTDETADAIPGFGAAVAIVAVAVSGLAVRRYRR